MYVYISENKSLTINFATLKRFADSDDFHLTNKLLTLANSDLITCP